MILNQKNEELILKTSHIFTLNEEAYKKGYRYIINTGGSSSTKTYSILQLIIHICITRPGTEVTIVRKSLPAVKDSVFKDWLKLMISLNLYNESRHQMTENYYKFKNGSIIKFSGVADSHRIRGARRDILYCNEANDLYDEEFNQLAMRSNICIFLDRNPSEADHWIDDLARDKRSIEIHSTWRDNPFLGQGIIQDIEAKMNTDPNYYRIYGLGLPPNGSTRIYNNFNQYVDLPHITDYAYGLDFGHTHPTALVKCSWGTPGIYIQELIYESGLDSTDVITLVKEQVEDNKPIYCDTANPMGIIEQLRKAGLNAKPSNKQVDAGIDSVRSNQIFINVNSVNIWREYKQYCWKTIGDVIQPYPLKMNDDCMDAIRYCIHTHKNKVGQQPMKRLFY